MWCIGVEVVVHPLLKQSWIRPWTARTCSTPNTGASFELITRRVSDDTELLRFNTPFPNFFKPLPQSEAWCTTIHMKMRFHSLAIKLIFI